VQALWPKMRVSNNTPFWPIFFPSNIVVALQWNSRRVRNKSAFSKHPHCSSALQLYRSNRKIITRGGGKRVIIDDSLLLLLLLLLFILVVAELQHKGTKWQFRKCGQKAGVVADTPFSPHSLRILIAMVCYNSIGARKKCENLCWERGCCK
jgi:hypothetical protein